MTFINRILLCVTVITSFTFGADYTYETHQPSSKPSYAELMTEPRNTSEQEVFTFQGLGRSIYNHRNLILTASFAYIAVTELPIVGASFLFPNYCENSIMIASMCRMQSFGSNALYQICCIDPY